MFQHHQPSVRHCAHKSKTNSCDCCVLCTTGVQEGAAILAVGLQKHLITLLTDEVSAGGHYLVHIVGHGHGWLDVILYCTSSYYVPPLHVRPADIYDFSTNAMCTARRTTSGRACRHQTAIYLSLSPAHPILQCKSNLLAHEKPPTMDSKADGVALL